jgi:hypothetical protein
MPARRCSIGCESWPDEPLFTTCIYCGERTGRVRNIEPTIDREEASRLILHALFDNFYKKRCLRMGIPPEGPLE